MEAKQLACSACSTAMVPVQRRAYFSVGGAVGAVLVAAGLVGLLLKPVIGAGLILAGLILGASGGTTTVMKCPKCGTEGARL